MPIGRGAAGDERDGGRRMTAAGHPRGNLTRSERRWAAGLLVAVAVLGLLYVAFALSRGSSLANRPVPGAPAALPASRIDLRVTMVGVDVLNNRINVEVDPVLRGTVGRQLGTVGQAAEPIRLFVDGARPAVQEIAAGALVEPFSASVPITDVHPLVDFPLDRYRGQLVATASSGATPIPVVLQPVSPGVAGFTITTSAPAGFSTSGALAAGRWVTSVAIARDEDVRFITLLVGLLLVCSAIGVFAVGLPVILGRREVHVEMLAWMAIFPFALIALRGVIPDAPPDGITFDVLAYYWAIALVFLTFIACVVRWLATRGAR